MKTVLVTGGAGYVGSHCCKAFAAAGWRVVVIDNLSRGWREAVRWGPLIEADISNAEALAAATQAYAPDIVAHFAAYAYVGESVKQPDAYYRNNLVETLALLDAMRANGINRMLFSSTCASYGHPIRTPIDETHPQVPINPYGWSKFMIERVLEDYSRAYGFVSTWLRYFNAAGCDPDGEIGECHVPETHAIPLAIAAALDPAGLFTVYGSDFETRDGTAVRDYIHVCDLASGHVAAAERLLEQDAVEVYNLGSGAGTTVMEMVGAVRNATGRNLKVKLGPRRAGDPAVLVALADKARRDLDWTPSKSKIDVIVKTALAWERTKAAPPKLNRKGG